MRGFGFTSISGPNTKPTEDLLKKQIENNTRNSKITFVISSFALICSLGILGLNSYNTFYKEHPLKTQLKTSIEKQEAILGLQDSYSNNLYSLDTTIINQIKSIKGDLAKDKLDRESILRKVGRIESKVNKLENKGK